MHRLTRVASHFDSKNQECCVKHQPCVKKEDSANKETMNEKRKPNMPGIVKKMVESNKNWRTSGEQVFAGNIDNMLQTQTPEYTVLSCCDSRVPLMASYVSVCMCVCVCVYVCPFLFVLFCFVFVTFFLCQLFTNKKKKIKIKIKKTKQ